MFKSISLDNQVVKTKLERNYHNNFYNRTNTQHTPLMSIYPRLFVVHPVNVEMAATMQSFISSGRQDSQ